MNVALQLLLKLIGPPRQPGVLELEVEINRTAAYSVER